MTEAQLQTKLTAWLKAGGVQFLCERYGINAAGVELKVCKGERMSFSQLSEGQEIALLRAAGVSAEGFLCSPVVHKISDMSAGAKPFDCFFMRGCGAFLIVGFCDGRVVVCIEAGKWWTWRAGRKRGSLTLADALCIGEKLHGVNGAK